MTADKQSVLILIDDCMSQLRKDLKLGRLDGFGLSTPILGGGSDLDSMAVVHLVADIESRLLDAYNRNWILADERALSRTRSPFRTVGDLADFIIETQPEE